MSLPPAPYPRRCFLSIVAPVYNEAGSLPLLHARLVAALEPLGRSFELWLVDDGSKDESWAAICALHEKDARVRGVRLTRNFGQHPALVAGLHRAKGEWVVLMDCDLQDRPEEIPRLLAAAQEGKWRVVMARRMVRQDSWFKRQTSQLFYRVLHVMADLHIDPTTANFGIYHRSVVRAFRRFREHHPFIPTMRSWAAFPTGYREVAHGEREVGSTAYTLGRMWRLASGVILSHSDKPLRLSIRLGFGLALGAVGVMGWLVVRALFWAVPVEGWTSLMVSLFFIGGLLLGNLGILGLYLGRVFEEAKGRPIYLAAEVL